VLIENQLERTDHTHLGQLLTYAAGLSAVTIIWVTQRFTEEHRAALDWLNECTSEKINFFGLEVELWRIGESLVAPKFNIISKPNEWTRSLQRTAAAGLTETKQLQLKFWTAFRDFLEQSKSVVRGQKPYPQNWMNHSIGRSGFRLCSIVSTWNSERGIYDPEIRVELVTDGKNAKQYFAALQRRKDEIHSGIGSPLTWHNPENANACRIYLRIDANFLDETHWPQQQQWLKENLETFHRVFTPIIRTLDQLT
jgi:hypothetical protein